jgi:hypothetical protein
LVKRIQLSGVVENDAQGESLPSPDLADTVTGFDAIVTTLAALRSFVNREDNAVAPLQWYDLYPGLHARPLFCHDKLATIEVTCIAQRYNDL